MKMFRAFSLFTLVGFFGAGINFLLMPFLSHYLSPEDYGTSSIINTYVSLLFPILGMNAYAILSVEYYRMKDRNDFATLFSTVNFIPLLPTILAAFVGVLLYRSLAPGLELPAGELWVGIVIFLLSLLINFTETANTYLVIAKRARLFSIMTVARVLVETSLTIWFVVYLRMGWKGRILSWVLAIALFSVIAFLIFYKEKLLRFSFRKTFAVVSIAYGLPIVPHAIGKLVINQADRVLIAKLVSLKEAGIYSIGYTIGMVIMLLCTAFTSIYSPFLMERLSNLTHERKFEIVRLSRFFIGFLLISVLLLNLVTPFIFRYFIDARYEDGAAYVFWISAGYFFWGCYLMFVGYLFYHKKTITLMWISVLNVVTNIILNYFLIKNYGGIGAAYASCISYMLVALIVITYSHRHYPMPWLQIKK